MTVGILAVWFTQGLANGSDIGDIGRSGPAVLGSHTLTRCGALS